MLNTDLGYRKEKVIVLHNSYTMQANIQSFKSELLRNPKVKMVSVSSYLPVFPSERTLNSFKTDGAQAENEVYPMQYWTVDHDYIRTMEMQIAQGRDFSKDYADDSTAIINEVALRQLGIENPIGSYITKMSSDPVQIERLKVVGVVKNFYFESLRENIGAVVLRLGNSANGVSIRTDTQNYKELLADIEGVWKRYTSNPLEYSFLADQYFNTYKAEQKVGSLLKSFAIIAIALASLGLYGLAAYILQQRSKEIGVRKVLGASRGKILFIFLSQFSKLILIAIIVAFPLTYFFSNSWLENFANRINFNLLLFFGISGSVLLVALLAVVFHALKAANLDPVKSVRKE
jgi:putative ABC transport system permease protein